MANDITSIHSSRLQQSGSRSSQRLDESSNKGDSANPISSDGADKVSLTSTAARLKDIERRLATSQTPIDDKRVKQVKSALNNGEYNVDADRVAHKMINFESSLHS